MEVPTPKLNQQSNPDSLPEGWVCAPLGKLARAIQYGYTASAIEARGPRLLRITDIQNGKVDWASVPSCDIDAEDANKFSLQEGDIVFARTGATTGKSFMIRSCPPAVFASYLIRVRSHRLISPAFLSFYFNTPEYWSFIMDNVAGNAQPNCNASKLSALNVLVAPEQEQRRIVEALEHLEMKVRLARERLAKVPKLLKTFRQSVLAAACSGRLTDDWREGTSSEENGYALLEEIKTLRMRTAPKRYQIDYAVEYPDTSNIPDTWAWSSIGNVTSHIGDVDHRMPKPEAGGIPYISTKDFTDNGIDFENAKRISMQDFVLLSRKIKPNYGDLILSRYGTIGEVRRICSRIPFQASYSIAIIKTLPVENLTDWLHLCLRTLDAQSQMAHSIRASSQPDLGLEYIRLLRIPVPPLSEQRVIIQRVDALFQLADKIEARVLVATKRADKLTQAILAKAFRGELVPTEATLARKEGRSYESAADLLTRIQAGRENTPGSTKGAARRKAKVQQISS